MTLALFEFHHHAGEHDILDELVSFSIPEAVGVKIERRPAAEVMPPTGEIYFSHGREAHSVETSVVIPVQCAKLHTVVDSVWMNWCGNCVANVSAVSRHVQTVIVSLRAQCK